MRNLIKCLLLATITLIAPAVFADAPTDIYQIEVIIFENKDPKRFQSENWPKYVQKLDLSKAIDLDTLRQNVPDSLDAMEAMTVLDHAGQKSAAKISQESINIVDPRHYLLTHELKTIKANRANRFIKHMAWMQPLVNNVKSTSVYFTTGPDQEITLLMSIKPNRNVFNLDLNLLYKIPAEDRGRDSEVEEIKITRTIKVKKKETYYVDHPVIGMIIIVAPVMLSSSSSSTLPNM